VSDVSCCTSDLSESLSQKTQLAKKRVSEVIGNSSAPQRHEKWIRARKKVIRRVHVRRNTLYGW